MMDSERVTLSNGTVTGWFRRRQMGYWLAICVLTAFALRLLTIQRYSLWVDEAISYLAAVMPVSFILSNAVQSSHPPLYYLLLHFWLPLWPDQDLFLRLFSLLWGILLLPSLYWLALELLVDRRLALLAVVLAVVSPFHILYSQELRMYTQLMVLVTLAAGAYMKGRRTGRQIWWLLFGIASLGALYTHLFTVFFLLAVGAHALVSWRDRRSLWLTLGIGIGLTILFLPWLFVLMSETQAESGSLRPLSTDVALVAFDPIKPLTTLSFLLFGLASNILYAGVALFLAVALLVMLSLEMVKRRRESGHEQLFLPAMAVLCIVGLPIAAYYLRPLFLPDRTMAAALPFLLVLISWGATRCKTPVPMLIGATLVAMIFGFGQYLVGEPIKSPYREAMAYVTREWQPGDVIVHTSDYSYLPALRYTDLPQHVLLDGRPGPLKPEAALKAMGGGVWNMAEIDAAGGRIWLIVALVDNLEWQQEQASYFAANYIQLQRHQVGGVEVFLFQISP
jgi:4-amino-4-deoxy-L-arabinose transferase-like glycosyltransferase